MPEQTQRPDRTERSAPAQRLKEHGFRWVHALGMIVLVGGLYVLGVIPGLDRALIDIRFLLFPRDATERTVIVQIDSKSIQQLGEWPWSRSMHAQAIRNLAAANPARIGVDIDFSSPSNPEADADLLDALKTAGEKVVLPVFKQWSSARGGEVTLTSPMPAFAEHARLGSVNLRPEADGLVRSYDRLHKWNTDFISAFASQVTAHPTEGTEPFYIDYSIRPGSIPRLSFADVVNGNFDAATVKDKYIIIGATALELGDEIAVPVYGALSGSELQAVAAESILQARTIEKLETPLALALAIIIGFVLSGWFTRLPHIAGTLAFLSACIVIIGAPTVLQAYAPLDLPAGASLITTAYCFVYGLTKQLDTQALIVFKRSAEIRERRALNQAIADNSFTGILVADDTGKIHFSNKVASELLEVPKDELIGETIQRAIVPVDEDILLDEPTSADTKTQTTLSIGANKMLPVELTISDIAISPERGPFERRTADRHFKIYAITDISEYKKTEEMLSKAANHAIEANRMKNEFIANISHELRTPLNAILGFSEVIKQEMFGPVGSTKYKSYADDIYASGSHLLAIINDLLEVSRLAAGKTEINATAVKFKDVVQECMRIAIGYPGAAQLEISSHVDEQIDTLWTDQRILKQIILNLLSNAIKFTPSGGRVGVTASLTELNGTKIIVEDTGIGIPYDQVSQVMEPFHQVKGAMQRNHQGSGLGLHLVKSQVALLGGTLAIDSNLGTGTRITVTFPPENTVKSGKIVKIDPRGA